MSASSLIAVAQYRVIFADCDPMRIMYYGNYFRLFEIGRAELFRRLGHPFPDYVARGLYLGVVEATCRYRRPARYDECLSIHAGLIDVRRASLAIDYEIVGPPDTLLASGRTAHAVLDDAGRPQRLPEDFRAAALASMRALHTPDAPSSDD